MTQITKLDRLLKQDQKLFHTQDLALLWNIENRNTLYTVIKRYVKKGVLIPIQKGLYSTLPIDKIDPLRLGFALIHTYCYLTTETILAKEGVILQKVYPVTFVSSIPKKIKVNENLFLFRKLKDKYLYQTIGVKNTNGVFVAEKERAVADMLYFNPKYYFDNPQLINWERVKEIQKKVGYI